MKVDINKLSLGSTEPFDYEPGAPRAKWSLTRLADFYRSDKGNITHRYTPRYQQLLEGMRDNQVRLLEIGVACGASLKMWSAWFRRGEVVGVDVNPKCAELCRRYARIDVRIADARADEIDGQFDIVIDDASHIPADIVAIWGNTWGNLKSGGWYFVEDLHCIGHEPYRRDFPERADEDFDPAQFRQWVDYLGSAPDIEHMRTFGKLLAIKKR